jgi:hypothetical protein
MVFFVVLLPTLFWQGGVASAPILRQAGIKHIAVPSDDAGAWKNVEGISADPMDLQGAIKLAAPGIDFHNDEASASRIPWITSNGWRFMRQPAASFYYDVPGNKALLAAAEAFCFGNHALIKTDKIGLTPLAKMLGFLETIPARSTTPVMDIAFVDDGSAAAGEVMNLMVRDNLLFTIITSPSANAKLIVRLGSKDYPDKETKDANLLVHKIRSNLGDSKRSVRIYGTSVVVARLTVLPTGLRLHLLNYGTATGTRVGEFRVRVLGQFHQGQIYSFGNSGEQLLDYETQADATEFTIPELKAYAIVDLLR